MIDLAKDKGYSETLFHRKRYLPELASSNHMMRAFGERVARNMPIQGTAADIIKIAMVKVDDRLAKENQIEEILNYTDKILLEEHLNLSHEEVLLLRGVWDRLSNRRIERKKDK